ncbi:hypothetical protein MRX96_007912 [Rhipicephalus microplus]
MTERAVKPHQRVPHPPSPTQRKMATTKVSVGFRTRGFPWACESQWSSSDWKRTKRQVLLFHILHANLVLIYLQEVSALRDLVKMVKALNAVVSLEKQIEEPVPGDLVAVLHKKDSTWYRGQIGLVKHNEKDAASGDRYVWPAYQQE